MSCMHVLMHHRQQRRIDDNQRRKVWDSFPTHAASRLTVGIMGLGVMGSDAGDKLPASRLQGGGLEPTPETHSGM